MDRQSRFLGLSCVLVLFLVLLTPQSASASATIQPDKLQTLSGDNIYFTVANGKSTPLFNITMNLPSKLPPAGFYSSAGRWSHIVTQERNAFRVAWFGGPVGANQSVILGVAVIVPPDTGTYNLTINANYPGNVTERSSLQLTIFCPCVFGIDVRSLSYSLVVIVLLLPLIEIGLRSGHLLRNGGRKTMN
jgi:hypothetical protein